LEGSIDAVGDVTKHVRQVEHVWRATLKASGRFRVGVHVERKGWRSGRSGRSGRSWVDWARDEQVWGMDGWWLECTILYVWGFSMQLRTWFYVRARTDLDVVSGSLITGRGALLDNSHRASTL